MQDFELIDSYTRAQALKDGVLIAVPIKDIFYAGIKWETALTNTLWAELTPSHEEAREGATHEGRLQALLVAFVKQAKSGASRGAVELLFVAPFVGGKFIEVKAVVGPDDRGKPCLTFMLPNED